MQETRTARIAGDRLRGAGYDVAEAPTRLFEERGCTPGRELDDRLRAEREMQEANRHDQA
jgi:hypothetical protein